LVRRHQELRVLGQLAYPSPGLREAPVMDWMCSSLVLNIAARQGSKFNIRRDLSSLLGLAGRHIVWPHSVLLRLREFMERRCRDNEAWRAHEALSHAEFLERYGVWRGPYEEGTLFFYLDDYAKDEPRDILLTLAATGEWLSHAIRKHSTLVEKNIDVLCGLLQLNRAERALLLYGTLARYQREMRSILVEFKVSSASEAYSTLAEVAGVKPGEIAEALRAGSRLERIGLVENLISEHNITDLADLMKVSEKLPPVLMREYQSEAELMAVFTRPSCKSSLSSQDFDFVQTDVVALRQLLANTVKAKEVGINVLIYGPPGTGKTELARVLAQEAGLDLYEVEHADRDGNALSGRDRYRSLQIAQVFLKATAHAALLFDEVEDVFPALPPEATQWMDHPDAGGQMHKGSVSGKAWVNQILESNPVPTLWVTNRIEQIDPAFRRRFAYHLHLQSPPPGSRERLVRQALVEALGADHCVAEELVGKLSRRPGLTPAQVHTAARFARLASSGPSEAQQMLERQLSHADAALGQAAAQPRAPSVTTFDLDMLNIESRHPVATIVQALVARGHGTLCFHGLPGTGKSALAEHIAQAMGSPLMVRKASDLVSKYVGETERNMARMFEQAECEKAVLLLDEADSFLADRRHAERNYEITEVNEMLQHMERFSGVFICTTNRMDHVDEAAMRRFSFKLLFNPLNASQRQQMLMNSLEDRLGAGLNGSRLARLDALDQLCLGDFATVLRQSRILGIRLDVEAFLSELELEHRHKQGAFSVRPIGFVA
jgi:SpoVK/Ycf46/Vps4 family AAA+-type ATPase